MGYAVAYLYLMMVANRSIHVVHANAWCAIPELCRMNNNKHYLTHNIKLQYNISIFSHVGAP
jgi:hypothetical protein